MRRRVTIILILAVTILVLLAGWEYSSLKPREDNIISYTETAENNQICLQKNNEKYYLLELDTGGSLLNSICLTELNELNSYTPIELAQGERPYLLLRKQNTEGSVYKVVRFDEELLPAMIWECPQIQEGSLGGLTVAGNLMFVCVLTEESTSLNAYSQDIFTAEPIWRRVLFEKAEDGRCFAAARYNGSELEYRYDDGTGKYTENKAVKSDKLDSFSGLNVFDLLPDIMRNIWLMAVVIGVAAILAILYVGSRSFVIRRLILTIIMLFLVYIAGVVANVKLIEQNNDENRIETARIVTEELMTELNEYVSADRSKADFTDTDRYREALKLLNDFMKAPEAEGVIDDVMLIAVNSTGVVIDLDNSGNRGCTAEQILGADAEDYLKGFNFTKKSGEIDISTAGSDYRLYCRTWQGQLKSQLIAVFRMPIVHAGTANYIDTIMMERTLLIPIVIGSLILLASIIAEERDFFRLKRAMQEVSRGSKTELDIPVIMNRDLRQIWSSLREIAKNKEKLHYNNDWLCNAYYRFAPKNIEKILQKESIIDVNVGDAKELAGVLATVSMTGAEAVDQDSYIQSMNRNFEIVCSAQMENDGILLSTDCNLSSLKALFTGEVDKAMRFGVDMMRRMDEEKLLNNQETLVFLHFMGLRYGVAGTREQAFPYISAAEFDQLNKYVPDLRKYGLRMIITEPVYSRLSGVNETRCIGYVELPTRSVKLYEVLDVYPAPLKERKKRANTAFQKALTLYYKNDYYLARSSFSEVLKDCPEDLIAKWYLFNSEKKLNSQCSNEFSYGLFSE